MINLFFYLQIIIQYTKNVISYLERHDLVYLDDKTDIIIFTEYLKTKLLSNVFGLYILFECQCWFETIIKAVDLEQEHREKVLDGLIAIKIPNYLHYIASLYKAIHASIPKDTLKLLDRWYDSFYQTEDENIAIFYYNRLIINVIFLVVSIGALKRQLLRT